MEPGVRGTSARMSEAHAQRTTSTTRYLGQVAVLIATYLSLLTYRYLDHRCARVGNVLTGNIDFREIAAISYFSGRVV